ncbi:hypothetical protein H9L39_06934 [Fusarium oxysporum f. sp. albedinis]|nr:hypothetical protein H9L39_06934 [Fusarium oxysporum f. sp. albedinis]
MWHTAPWSTFLFRLSRTQSGPGCLNDGLTKRFEIRLSLTLDEENARIVYGLLRSEPDPIRKHDSSKHGNVKSFELICIISRMASISGGVAPVGQRGGRPHDRDTR